MAALPWVAVILALGALPWALGNYPLFVLAITGTQIIIAVSLNVLAGYADQVTLAHAATVGVGAYTTAVLAGWGWPFVLCLATGALAGGLVSLVGALPALRLSGLYLAISTLAFQFAFTRIAFLWRRVTGGANGLTVPRAQWGNWVLASDAQLYWLVLAALVLVTAVATTLARGRSGRAWLALHQNPLAALAAGVHPARYRLFAFVASGLMAGLGGGLYAYLLGFIAPGNFGFEQTMQYYIMIIIGGLASVPGAVIGGLLVGLAGQFLVQFLELQGMVFGLLVMLTLLLYPGGVAGLLRRKGGEVLDPGSPGH